MHTKGVPLIYCVHHKFVQYSICIWQLLGRVAAWELDEGEGEEGEIPLASDFSAWERESAAEDGLAGVVVGRSLRLRHGRVAA